MSDVIHHMPTCLECGASVDSWEKICPVCEIEFEEANDNAVLAWQNGHSVGFLEGWDVGFKEGYDSAYEDRIIKVITFFIRCLKNHDIVRIRDIIRYAQYRQRNPDMFDDIPF